MDEYIVYFFAVIFFYFLISCSLLLPAFPSSFSSPLFFFSVPSENTISPVEFDDGTDNDGLVDSTDIVNYLGEGRVFFNPVYLEEGRQSGGYNDVNNKNSGNNNNTTSNKNPDNFVPAAKMYNIWIDLADAPKPEEENKEKKEQDEKRRRLRRLRWRPRFVFPPFPESPPPSLSLSKMKNILSFNSILGLSYAHPQTPHVPMSLLQALDFGATIHLPAQVCV
jgi:hypothetical protein